MQPNNQTFLSEPNHTKTFISNQTELIPGPIQIKCRRKGGFPDSGLEWSHVPLCYPSVLVSKTHWTKVLHARSVSCTGDARTGTTCKLTCIREGQKESHASQTIEGSEQEMSQREIFKRR